MPIHQLKNISEHGKVGVWNISETKEKLIELLAVKGFNIDSIPTYKNESHLKQWLAVRLLCYAFLDDFEISYNENGKPYLNSGIELSVSHSGNYAAIIINNTKCGIDIEKISPKVERIKHKFLNESELKLINSSNNQLETLTIYWSAKEALYKLYGDKELIFKDQLLINSTSDKNLLEGIIKTESVYQSYNMEVDFFSDYVLVYTI